MTSLLLLAAVLRSAPLPPPPPPPPLPAGDCFPTCRSGYFCHVGQCVSACNPVCGRGEQCTEAGQCVPLGSDAPVASSVSHPDWPVVGEDGERAPRGMHFENKRTRGLIVAGTVMMGVSYFVSVFAAVFGYDNTSFFPAANGQVVHNEDAYLLYAVPLVGPLLGRAELTSKYGGNLSGAVDWLFAVVASAAQVGGLAMVVLGSRKTEHLVSDDEYAQAHAHDAPPVRWCLSPGASSTPMGLTLTIAN